LTLFSLHLPAVFLPSGHGSGALEKPSQPEGGITVSKDEIALQILLKMMDDSKNPALIVTGAGDDHFDPQKVAECFNSLVSTINLQ